MLFWGPIPLLFLFSLHPKRCIMLKETHTQIHCFEFTFLVYIMLIMYGNSYLFCDIEGAAYNTHHSNWTNESNCWSCRRICLPCKFLCVMNYQDPLVEKLISFCTGHMQMHACCICVFKYICICQNNLFFLPQANVHSKVISVLQLVDN